PRPAAQRDAGRLRCAGAVFRPSVRRPRARRHVARNDGNHEPAPERRTRALPPVARRPVEPERPAPGVGLPRRLGEPPHSVNVGGYAGVRWYQLANSGAGWSVFQQGTHAPDTDNRFMSSGGIDNSGELALAYSVSSATTYPSLYYTGRLPGDPAGVMSIPETS